MISNSLGKVTYYAFVFLVEDEKLNVNTQCNAKKPKSEMNQRSLLKNLIMNDKQELNKLKKANQLEMAKLKEERKLQYDLEKENKIILHAQRVEETNEYKDQLKRCKKQHINDNKIELKAQKSKQLNDKKAKLTLERKEKAENRIRLYKQRIEETTLYKKERKALKIKELNEHRAQQAKELIEKRTQSKLEHKIQLENRVKIRVQKVEERKQAKLQAHIAFQIKRDHKYKEKAENRVRIKNAKINNSKEKQTKVKNANTLIKSIIIDLTSQAFALKDLDLIKSTIIDYIEDGIHNKDIKYIIRFKCVIEIKNIKYIAMKEKVNLEDFISKLASLRNSAHRLIRSYSEFYNINKIIKQLQFKSTNMLRIYNYSDVLFSDINFIRENVLKMTDSICNQLRPGYMIKSFLSIIRINLVNVTNNDIFIFTDFNKFQEKVLLAKKQVLNLTSSKIKKPYINDKQSSYDL